jgi:ABC-2 type transport system permease protein
MAINLAAALIMSSIMFSGQLQVLNYSILNLITFGCLYVISSLSFLFSCLFNDSKRSLSFSAGLGIFFVVVKMISGISEQLSFLKYLSLFSIIDVERILSDQSYNLMMLLATFSIASLIYALSIIIFDKRSLNI